LAEPVETRALRGRKRRAKPRSTVLAGGSVRWPA
jgi:hypothetical protein